MSARTKNSAEQLALGLLSCSPQETVEQVTPVIFKSDLEKMKVLMKQQFYNQSNLTISVLAEALGMPEHRLRMLINKHLGYHNFSVFLNSYRIPAAIETLKNPQHLRLPVLTIALVLDYGSFGPFNRASKQVTSFTPNEYRKKIQKRP